MSVRLLHHINARSRGLACAGLVVLMAAGGCRRDGSAPPPPPAAAPEEPSAPAAVALPDATQQSLLETAISIDDAEMNLARAERDLASSVERFRRQNPGRVPAELGDATFTDDERNALAEFIAQEKGSRIELVRQILQKDRNIQSLRSQLESQRQQLPANYESVEVKASDRHYNIAIDYLRKQGVSAEKAVDLVRQINLVEPLVPGFRVWTTFNDGQFGTWVTRGSANISPQEAQTRVARALESTQQELDRARAENVRVRADLDALAKETDAVIAEADKRRQEADDLRRKADESAAALKTLNVVHYTVGTKRDLQRANVVDGNYGFKGMPAVTDTLDLGQNGRDILIDPGVYKLKRVRKVVVAPTNMFKEGADFRVTSQDGAVILTVLDAETFKRNRHFVVVLE